MFTLNQLHLIVTADDSLILEESLGSFQMYLFVCVEVLWPSQSNRVMLSMVSLPNHTFTGQAWSSKQITSIVHILSPGLENPLCETTATGRKLSTDTGQLSP